MSLAGIHEAWKIRDVDFNRLLRFPGTLFEFNAEFWSRIGEDLRDLQLKDCDLSIVVFYSILQECQNLESLELTGTHSLADVALFPIIIIIIIIIIIQFIMIER